jgi:hypothetical protein
LANSTSYEAPHYAVFSNLLSLHTSSVQIFSKHHKSLKCSPLEELESALAAQFKQARESNASIDGTHLKERGIHISARLEIANFSASNGWIGRFNRRHSIAYRNLSGESTSADAETVEEWTDYCKKLKVMTSDIYI